MGSLAGRPLVTDELVEFETYPVEVHDLMKITDGLRGIYGIYPQFHKGKPIRKISTCNLSGWTWTREDVDRLDYAQKKSPRALEFDSKQQRRQG
jgi:hypothetical protein